MAFSHGQRMVLAVLPKISSVFSLFGSLWIIIEVTTEGRKIQNPYHRLLLAMSVYDTLESFWNFGSTWPIVEGSPEVFWAMGTVATCEAQGFFLTLSVAVPIYNAMLSIYYILVINYRYTNRQLRQRVEPIMHFIAFFWSFGTAGYSAATGLFNNANLWCWIAPLPLDCQDTLTYGTVEDGNEKPCIRGDNVWVYRFGFYFIPLWFCIFFATACTLWVYKFVYTTDKQTLAYRRPETSRKHTSWWAHDGAANNKASNEAHVSQLTPNNPQSAATGSAQNPTSKKAEETNIVESDDTKAKEVGRKSGPIVRILPQLQSEMSRGSSLGSTGNQLQTSIGKRIDLAGSVHDVKAGASESGNGEHDAEYEDLKDGEDKKGSQNDQENDDTKSVADSIDEDEELRKIDILVASSRQSLGDNNDDDDDEEKREESFVFDDLNDVKSSEDEDFSRQNYDNTKSIRARVKKWKSRRVEYAEDMPRTYEVFKQACFYLGAFYCTHVWSTSNRVVQTISGGGTVFPLIACHSFFDPFQGFLNYLVYQRPRFIQLKKKHPELGWWGILIKSLRFSFMDAGRSGSTRAFGDSRNTRNSFRNSRTASRSSLGGSSVERSKSGDLSNMGSSRKFEVDDSPDGDS